MILGMFLMMCFIAVVIISIGTSIIRAILHSLLGLFGCTRRPHGQNRQANHSNRQSQSQQSPPSGGKKRDKIFDKTDGEYVDFEEIKE